MIGSKILTTKNSIFLFGGSVRHPSGGLELSHVGGAAQQVNEGVAETGGDSKGKASKGLGSSMSSVETT